MSKHDQRCGELMAQMCVYLSTEVVAGKSLHQAGAVAYSRLGVEGSLPPQVEAVGAALMLLCFSSVQRRAYACLEVHSFDACPEECDIRKRTTNQQYSRASDTAHVH
jgi:hypothetical protein